jgi:hypothetical protein
MSIQGVLPAARDPRPVGRACVPPESGQVIVQSNNYWSGVEFDSGNAWNFNFNNGNQNTNDKNNNLFAWAVRFGDVVADATVPEPATAVLLGASLIGFAAARRRARRPGNSVL